MRKFEDLLAIFSKFEDLLKFTHRLRAGNNLHNV